MSRRCYVNAREALPPELLAEVRKHVSGLVWIPAPNAFFRERRELILGLRAEGASSREIARLAGLSVRRVNQIISEKKSD